MRSRLAQSNGAAPAVPGPHYPSDAVAAILAKRIRRECARSHGVAPHDELMLVDFCDVAEGPGLPVEQYRNDDGVGRPATAAMASLGRARGGQSTACTSGRGAPTRPRGRLWHAPRGTYSICIRRRSGLRTRTESLRMADGVTENAQ